MERLSLATLTTQNIASPLLVATYTATADKELLVQVYMSGLAGNGTYRACVSKQLLGTSTVYQSPTSGASLAATVTTAFLPSIPVPVKNTDVLKVYVQGLTADTSTGIQVEIWDITPTASASMTVGEIADAVWDEALSGHATAGSAGKALTDAGGAADPLLNAVPGTYPTGSAGAALGRIGSNTVTITAPVSDDGEITLIYGDDYANADGRALAFTGTNWPTITGGTVALIVDGLSGVTSVSGTVTGAAACYVELTSVQVNALGVGVWDYDLQATLTSGKVATLQQGLCHVVEDVR